MRVVLDTNILLCGLLWTGKPSQILSLARTGKVQNFTSNAILKELSNNLRSSKFTRKVIDSHRSIDQLIGLVATISEVVEPTPTPRIAPFPEDDVILGTALAAQATYLITGDKPFLSVGSFQSVQLVTVTQFLDILTTPSQTTG